MKLPKIILGSRIFVDQFMPLAGIPIPEDQKLLTDINHMWSKTLFHNSRANTPRIPNWEPLYDSVVVRPHQFADTCKALGDIGNDRARELISRNLPIKLFWSGGIDSTLALCHILENLQDPNQLTIYHTCASINESPNFLDHIKKFNVKMDSWSDGWETKFDPDDLIITGVSSDNITASIDESFYHQFSEWLHRPWQDFFMLRGMDSKKIELVAEKIALHDNPVTSVLEFRWWFYYAIRHQFFVVKDWELNLENGPGHNVECFFNCYDYDAWSQVNRNNFVGNTWQTYKQAFKDQIYKMWSDRDYRDNKTKQNSTHNIMWTKRKLAHFDNQYLFTYLTRHNQAKIFRPRYFPIIDLSVIMEDLQAIEHEF